MKKIVLIYMILFLSGCATTSIGVQYRTKDISSSFTNPSDYMIAILPTKSVGNPNKTSEEEITMKFESGLKEIGFKVIDSYFVAGVLKELNIDLNNDLSIDQMREIQQKLNCNLLCISTADYSFIPGRSGAYVNQYGGGGSSTDGYYKVTSETFKIVNPTNLETLVSISKLAQNGRSMSADIILALKEHFNNSQ